MEFKELICIIKKWIRNVEIENSNILVVEFVHEEDCFLYYNLESRQYIADLVIEPEGFHPHRYVLFQALDKTKDIHQNAYLYLDNQKSSVSDIVKGLNEAISYITK